MVDERRRRFLKYAGIAAAGVAAAGYLGYPYVSRLLQNPQSSTTTSTISSASSSSLSSYTPPPDAPPDYAEFLIWLHSVAGPYAGKNLNIALENEPTPLATQLLDQDFFKASGINDQYNIKPYSLHLSDLSLMVNTQSPSYDVYDVDHQDVGFFKDHILSPTQLADKYPGLTFAPITSGDFPTQAWEILGTYPPATVAGAGSAGKDTVFVPYDMDLLIQYYRKDVYQTLGLTPATTWDEYYQNVKKSSTGSGVRFATVNMASPGISVVYEYLTHLASFGGQLWSYDGTSLTTQLGSQEALAALENYVQYYQYADLASPQYTWDEVNTDLYNGIAVSALHLGSFSYYMEDQVRSRVVGKVSYASAPAGKNGSFSTFAGSGIGVSKYSKNPEASWLWLQWATAKGTQEAAALTGYRAYPSRKSVFGSSALSSLLGGSAYSSMAISKKVWDAGSVTSLVAFPKWFSALDAISYHINQAYGGLETPQSALSNATQKLNTLGQLGF